MPSVDAYENFLKQSQVVAGDRHPPSVTTRKATETSRRV